MVMSEALERFKKKRIVVTGDTGFKGSWLSLWLHDLGADVVGFSLPPERDEDHFNKIGLDRIIHHTDGNICDFESIEKVFKEFQPEFVFHLAAQALVRLSYEDPKLTFDTNVGGSVNILDAARNCPSLRSLIYITSDKCYRNKEWVWGYRENDELGGDDPYSASKAAAEIVFSAYMRSFFRSKEGFGAASVRAGNVIGGGDWALDRIMPDCIRALKSKQQIVLRNPSSIRPWQHVLDPLSGYLLLASRLYEDPLGYSGVWNFGPRGDSLRTVKDLTEMTMKCWDGNSTDIKEQNIGPHEANLLHLNCEKSNHVLGWRPQWDFDRAVQETVFWYKEVHVGKPALQVSDGQIMRFMEEIR